MLSDPNFLLAVAYFALAALCVLTLWLLDRVTSLEERVMRIERAKAREIALLRDIRNGYPSNLDNAPEDPVTILDFPEERRRS